MNKPHYTIKEGKPGEVTWLMSPFAQRAKV
jgi:hypothetical protein